MIRALGEERRRANTARREVERVFVAARERDAEGCCCSERVLVLVV